MSVGWTRYLLANNVNRNQTREGDPYKKNAQTTYSNNALYFNVNKVTAENTSTSKTLSLPVTVIFRIRRASPGIFVTFFAVRHLCCLSLQPLRCVYVLPATRVAVRGGVDKPGKEGKWGVVKDLFYKRGGKVPSILKKG